MRFSCHPQFITITAYEWLPLLKLDKHKETILDSLAFIVTEKRALIYGFVIMDNHFHLIWQVCDPHKKSDLQRDFLKFISQQIKFHLVANYPEFLTRFEVKKKDRRYQFWKRNSLSIDLYSEKVFQQKLDYIHDNPVKAERCVFPEDYYYSSARYYSQNTKEFDFLSHHDGV